jgi:hypothetical protein
MMPRRVRDVFIHVLLPKNPLQVVGRDIGPILPTVFAKGDLWQKNWLIGP